MLEGYLYKYAFANEISFIMTDFKLTRERIDNIIDGIINEEGAVIPALKALIKYIRDNLNHSVIPYAVLNKIKHTVLDDELNEFVGKKVRITIEEV